jgi:voltage-gated potassium channel
VLYALTLLAQAAIQTEVGRILGSRRRIREMERFDSHFIVCGAGRVGRRVIRNLQRQGEKFVVIDNDAERLAPFNSDVYVIEGDATDEDILLSAGVKRARGLAACLPDDAANVYVVLTARGLNPSLHIVARAVEEQAEPKLIRAGASRVVSPTIIGSQSMARALLNPAIADFMDSIVAESLDLVFEEVAVDQGSPLAGRTLGEDGVFNELSVIVVAIRRGDGDLAFRPRPETKLAEGDLLIVVGKAESVKHLIDLNK